MDSKNFEGKNRSKIIKVLWISEFREMISLHVLENTCDVDGRVV